MKKKLLIKTLAYALACAALLGTAIPVTIHCCHEAAEKSYLVNDDYLELCVYTALEEDGYSPININEWFIAYDAKTALVVTDDAKAHRFNFEEPQPWFFVWREIA